MLLFWHRQGIAYHNIGLGCSEQSGYRTVGVKSTPLLTLLDQQFINIWHHHWHSLSYQKVPSVENVLLNSCWQMRLFDISQHINYASYVNVLSRIILVDTIGIGGYLKSFNFIFHHYLRIVFLKLIPWLRTHTTNWLLDSPNNYSPKV